MYSTLYYPLRFKYLLKRISTIALIFMIAWTCWFSMQVQAITYITTHPFVAFIPVK